MKIIFQEAFVKAFFVLKESVLAFIPFGVGFKEYLAAYQFIRVSSSVFQFLVSKTM